MHLLETFLPLFDNDGKRLAPALFDRVREELMERFGGLTAFSRSPGEGLWQQDGERSRDDLVIFEVMTDELDRDWWSAYRQTLERLFEQGEILVRSTKIERI